MSRRLGLRAMRTGGIGTALRLHRVFAVCGSQITVNDSAGCSDYATDEAGSKFRAEVESIASAAPPSLCSGSAMFQNQSDDEKFLIVALSMYSEYVSAFLR